MRPVTVEELQRAWWAVQRGDFSARHPRPTADTPTTEAAWTPPAGESVRVVVGATGSCGATTLSLALATARGGSARVVECAAAAASGLAAAARTELGVDSAGWVRGARDTVLLDRLGPAAASGGAWPRPAPLAGLAFTVLDAGATPDPGWVAATVAAADALVVVARATTPGLRRLETRLTQLRLGQRAVVALVGSPRGRWPTLLLADAGPLTRGLADEGLLVGVPWHPQLELRGITPAPLPAPLVAAAARVLDRLEGLHP